MVIKKNIKGVLIKMLRVVLEGLWLCIMFCFVLIYNLLVIELIN